MQPLLGVCMSYQTTLNIVEKISQDHDMEVQIWADELANLIEKPSSVSIIIMVFVIFTFINTLLNINDIIIYIHGLKKSDWSKMLLIYIIYNYYVTVFGKPTGWGEYIALLPFMLSEDTTVKKMKLI